jgi:hypothetical protein
MKVISRIICSQLITVPYFIGKLVVVANKAPAWVIFEAIIWVVLYI